MNFIIVLTSAFPYNLLFLIITIKPSLFPLGKLKIWMQKHMFYRIYVTPLPLFTELHSSMILPFYYIYFKTNFACTRVSHLLPFGLAQPASLLHFNRHSRTNQALTLNLRVPQTLRWELGKKLNVQNPVLLQSLTYPWHLYYKMCSTQQIDKHFLNYDFRVNFPAKNGQFKKVFLIFQRIQSPDKKYQILKFVCNKSRSNENAVFNNAALTTSLTLMAALFWNVQHVNINVMKLEKRSKFCLLPLLLAISLIIR